MKKFSKAFLRNNDSFFEQSCCFRLHDNRMVLVYEKEKNANYAEILDVMYHEFIRACGKYDYRVKVYCQPVLNTVTNQFTTAEALMRLELPEVGMVFPDQFTD